MHPPLKRAPASWIVLCERAWCALGFPDRLPAVIGLDGMPGAGKSSLASWLAWQLGAKAVHLDLYVQRKGVPLSWRTEELSRVLDARLSLGRPVIVEGIMLLDALAQIGREPDFLAWIEHEQPVERESQLSDHVLRYAERTRSPERAHLQVRWSDPDYVEAVRSLTAEE
jgi:hypothetical protein